jgi:GPH family glycoside/pentoside/hexuronide:cation symporter
MKAEISSPQKLNFSTKLAFGAGDLGPAICANILIFYLLFFFANVAGLPPGLAGSILMITKIWDAITDPIVGIWSDRTKHPLGRRYPWMLFASIPFGIFFFLQWLVPFTETWPLFWYYLVVSLLFSTAYTCINMPYVALTPELTEDYNERTSLNSFRFAFSIGGSIFSLILARIIFLAIEDNPTMEFLVLGTVVAIIAVLPIYWCFFGTRHRVSATNQEKSPQAENQTQIPALEQIKVALSNRPFLYVIGIYLFSWLAVQLTASILPFFVVNWMGLSEDTFPLVAIAVQGTALVMLFVWTAVSKKVGKKAVYFMGVGFWFIAQAGLFLLQPGQVGLMYSLAVLAGIGVSTAYLVPWSLIPDVIDLDELNTGERREGVFYSFMVFLQKIGLALGLFLVGQALEIAGFIERVPGEPLPVQPESALLAIRIAIGPLPTCFLIGGIILATFYPITKTVHEEILLKLKERKQIRNGE